MGRDSARPSTYFGICRIGVDLELKVKMVMMRTVRIESRAT